MKTENFIKLTKELDANVKKVPLKKNVHMVNDTLLSNGYRLFGNKVTAQYLGRINQPLKISLSKVVDKLNNLPVVEDGRMHGYEEPINPSELSDKLIRLGELMRDKDVYAYVDKSKNDLVYGVVSDQHTHISDYKMYDLLKTYFDEIKEPYTMSCDHDIYTSRIDVDFKETGVEIAKGDIIGMRFTARNSAYGHGALQSNAGALRLVCTNGLTVKEKDTQYYWQVHKISAEIMLNKFLNSINKVIKQFDRLTDKIKQASEITEIWIDEKTSVTKYLPSKFDIRVKEAQEVFRLMRTNPKYKNTAFWVGQAIAEVARNLVLEDRTRLEEIAGEIVFAQL